MVFKTALLRDKKIVSNEPDSGTFSLAATGTPAPHNFPVHHQNMELHSVDHEGRFPWDLKSTSTMPLIGKQANTERVKC